MTHFFAYLFIPRGAVLLCVFLSTPLRLQVGLAALLWGAKAPVVANGAMGSHRPLAKRVAEFFLFVFAFHSSSPTLM